MRTVPYHTRPLDPIYIPERRLPRYDLMLWFIVPAFWTLLTLLVAYLVIL